MEKQRKREREKKKKKEIAKMSGPSSLALAEYFYLQTVVGEDNRPSCTRGMTVVHILKQM